MEGCMAPGGPCNTETGDTNCCYAFGTYKCMGDLGKQKCTYAPSYLNMSDSSSSSDNTATAASKDTCRALVLSGGGSNGAWEAGVIYGFANYGNASDFEWDVISGVSAGSINALAIAVKPIGQEKSMSEWLSNLWLNLKNSDVYVDWGLGGKARGLAMQGGILNNAPLLTFLQNIVASVSSI